MHMAHAILMCRIIIKTFILQFVITKGHVTSRPALCICLCLFQIIQLVHDFIRVGVEQTAVTAKIGSACLLYQT